jgi:hypothetical protein
VYVVLEFKNGIAREDCVDSGVLQVVSFSSEMLDIEIYGAWCRQSWAI